MQLRHIALEHFRNIPIARLDFPKRCAALIGENAQGKTNLIEAIGLLTALRSFRQTDARLLIAHGQSEARIFFKITHEREGEVEVSMRLSGERKEVSVDGERVVRLADFLGRFPAVVLSSQDIQILRGGPALRRRWMDLALSVADRGYLDALQRYHRALDERNALLKTRCDAAQLDAFETLMAAAAAELVAARTIGLAQLGGFFCDAYGKIAPRAGDVSRLVYVPDFAERDAADFAALFASQRERDFAQKTTTRGPHRDDFDLQIGERSGSDFGSEGQQRSLVLSLRLAEWTLLRERLGVRPLLLADDVLGELDAGRRECFWKALDPEVQVIATGTREPDLGEASDWQFIDVARGSFSAR